MIELQDFFSTFWNKSSQGIIDNNISTGNRNSANQDGKNIMLKLISIFDFLDEICNRFQKKLYYMVLDNLQIKYIISQSKIIPISNNYLLNPKIQMIKVDTTNNSMIRPLYKIQEL